MTKLDLAPPTWHFVPADLDAGDIAALEPLFAELDARPIADVADLERWLHDESELMSRIGAEIARRYIAMTCHTDDTTARDRFLAIERDVSPRVKVLADRLDRRFLALPQREQLDPQRYALLVRRRASAVEIFREANTVLQTEESELQTRQQALMGGIVVSFDGRDHTLQQMSPYAESQDRDVRRRAFLASLGARRTLWRELEEIYDRLIALRTRMGRNAGFEGYTPLRFRELQRFDYDVQTCLRFHDAIEKAVVPAVVELNEQRRQRLGLETLRPFDLEVDLDGRPPLRPFTDEASLKALVRDVFRRVDARFAHEFAVLEDNRLLDLMSRKGKAPGGYQYTLEDVRLPFVFANSVGTHQDVQTMLHEGGHAFHAILSRNDPLLSYRDSPIEFAETASMSMELMGLEELGSVYGEADARRARRKHLEGVLRILPWIASIDAFQHWVYGHPDHDHDERRDCWRQIRARFAPGLDWSGLDDALAMSWVSQGHLFGHPFYYVEYGIAQIAALQVWQRYRNDKASAVAAYRNGLSLGGTRPLPQLFEAAGVRFDVSATMLQRLVADVLAVIRAD